MWQKSPIQVLKFVAPFFNFPSFEADQFFSKLAYSANRRRITLLGRDDLFKQVRNGRISNDRIVHVPHRLRDAEHSLEYTKTGNNVASHPYPVLAQNSIWRD